MNLRDKFKATYTKDSKVFADEKNKVFALDSREDILNSVEVFSNYFRDYKNKDVIAITERIVSVANALKDEELSKNVEKSVNNIVTKLSEVNDMGGNMDFKVFKTEAEFNDFVKSIKDSVQDENITATIKQELAEKVQEIESIKTEHEQKIGDLNKTVAEQEKEIEKQKAEIRFNDRAISVAKKLKEAKLGDFAEEAKQWVNDKAECEDEDFEKYVEAQISMLKKAQEKFKKDDDPDPKDDLAKASDGDDEPEETPEKKLENVFKDELG